MTKQDNFSTTLRDQPNRLPNPTNYGFDPKVWHDAFQVLNDGSPQDLNLYLLGLVFGHQSKRVINSVEHISSKTKFYSLPELASHFSRRANDVMRMAFDSYGRALENVDAISQEQTREMKCFVDSAGNSYSVQVPMEAVVDAIGNAMKMLNHTGGFGKLNSDEIEYIDIKDSLCNLLDLAQHSLSIQCIWGSVIWLRAHVQVDPHSGNYIVDETKSDLARRSAIDLSRRPVFMARSFDRFESLESLPDANNVLIPQVNLEGGRLTVRAVPAFKFPEEELDSLIKARRSHGLLQDGVLRDFVEAEHPSVGLTISEMILIWGELALIAQQLHALAQSLDTEKDKSTLAMVLNSQFRLSDIVTVIKSCVVLSRERTAECLEFLCFRPTKGALCGGTLFFQQVTRFVFFGGP
ncbi:hypothetical protein [Undibacterium sp. RuTC16W]|uniref:hypothetical protein n=1 Tax=Undibacterium sp. RuTC16W TaxID=3413048 RepID=UPI003BF4006B